MTRARYLRAHPSCAHPGCPKAATDVDHIIARRDGGTDQWDNLRPLCHPHHSQRTAADQPGGWNAR
jgi:5-methylcytosine-specific restriction endonuclease McrA